MKRLIIPFLLIGLLFGCTGTDQAKKENILPVGDSGKTGASDGFYISKGRLIDAKGNEFIIRGISHAHCWFTNRTSALSDIKQVGANAVRLVLSNGVRWQKTGSSELTRLLELCRENRLIAIPEVHDTTGYGEVSSASSLSQAVDYWKTMEGVLKGQEAYVIINIGNEPYGNRKMTAWVNDTKNAILSMRAAGFKHTLIVDAPNWGQDWALIMRNNARSVYETDPDRNTILSVHMYGHYNTKSRIRNYITRIKKQGLPLLIGEFGILHTDGDPDEKAIMAAAGSEGIGYIGWSWCGNSSEVSYLDIVKYWWDVNSLTEWGNILINGDNGIATTSRECSVFADE